MKIPSGLDVKKNWGRLTQTTSQIIDNIESCVRSGYHSFAHNILSPQSAAAYTGLKKLVEKDYHPDTEEVSGSLLSS